MSMMSKQQKTTLLAGFVMTMALVTEFATKGLRKQWETLLLFFLACGVILALDRLVGTNEYYRRRLRILAIFLLAAAVVADVYIWLS